MAELAKIREEAEKLYKEEGYCCSEAVICAIRKHMAPDMSAEIVAASSGFCGGIGWAGATCGALNGGIISLGYFFGRVSPKDDPTRKALKLSRELHDWFVHKYEKADCGSLTRGINVGAGEHKGRCAVFTGEIAAKAAEIISRERG